jgi:Fic family protein
LLQTTRDTGNWHDWLLFMLDGVEQTARQTTALITAIVALMQRHKHTLRAQLPKIYSQDLINNLFRHPYTKIEFVMTELQVHRNTASRYLDELVHIGLLTRHKLGKENFYLNSALYELLRHVNTRTDNTVEPAKP